MNANAFLEAVRSRRTIYSISKDTQVGQERIEQIVREAVKHTPSAFNSQSARVLVLFGEQHDKLWDITLGVLKAIVPPDSFASTEKRIGSFRAGYGSILYFEDQSDVEALQAKFPSYAERFPTWSQQSSGMLQYVIWTALELEGLGASLQHYNPLIDELVRSEWDIPATWQLIAQMPFGQPAAPPGDKEFKPVDERVKVHQ
ncbi:MULTISPECIES: nitroreductase family protein [Paenibacillus]|uniref:nitroreductase family protein n=1 Tax=Paenibacillus TaxID=44249 RepID=UPI0022B8B5B0|nr:nitroreductase family protein [Paenibacillus caseinilyticus]MCZ8521777.1 nitroreductase family protein [Paenibacillus caseinilyticus]